MKLEWETFQVSDPIKGTKLVSQLSPDELRNELCYAIDYIDKLVALRDEAIAALKRPIGD